MLEARVPAGIEAPIRFYVTEEPDGSASLTYRLPSAVLAPYESADFDAMVKELDQIWQKIVDDDVGRSQRPPSAPAGCRVTAAPLDQAKRLGQRDH